MTSRSNEDDRIIKALGGQGILRPCDIPDLRTQRAKVAALMMDREWHTAREIVKAAGGSEGLRRLRELRDLGAIIEKHRMRNRRMWKYRIKVGLHKPKRRPPPQMELI